MTVAAVARTAPPSLGGVSSVERGTADYPVALLDLERPPARVWIAGNAALGAFIPTVAVVGTRDATPYGQRVTRDLVTALARAGACVVSGMARGIDSIGHQAALACGGPTIAVLGTGVDIAYPPSNRQLHRQIAERGLLLAEYPPGQRPHGGSFLQRNRLIAALASVTIVVEGGHQSGALKTAAAAEAMSRTVAAVPGPIDSPQSAGTNQLIRDGAQVIASIEDALSLAGLSPRPMPVVRLDDDAQRRVWEALAQAAPSLDVLCARAGLPARACLEAITALELQGAVECALTGDVRRRG